MIAFAPKILRYGLEYALHALLAPTKEARLCQRFVDLGAQTTHDLIKGLRAPSVA